MLVPAGLLALCLLVRRAGVESLPAVAFARVPAGRAAVRLVYQKYFDPMVLVTLALLARPPDLRRRADYAGAAVLCVAFVAYALSFAATDQLDRREVHDEDQRLVRTDRALPWEP